MPEQRVMVVSHGHPERSPGGGENAAYALFEGLRARADVKALFVSREAPALRRGVTLGQGSPDGAEIMLRSQTEPFRISQRSPRVIHQDFPAILEWFRPTVVHFQHYFQLGVELLRAVHEHAPGVPIVLTLHEFLAMCHHNGQMVKTGNLALCRQASPDACHGCFPEITPEDFFLRELYVKSFFGLVDAFVSPSAFLADRYVAWGLPRERFNVIENGLRRVATDADGRRPRNGPPRRFAFFGQIIPYKGLDVLLEAMALLPLELRTGPDAIRLDIHGARLGDQTSEYQDRIRERLALVKQNVRFRGPYSPSDLPSLMGSVDWMVMPSIWWENSPVVIQEAFAHGVPVICSGIGGMAEKVQDGISGLHFRVGDPQGLADRLVEAATTPGLHERLQSGLPDVTSAARTAELHMELYERLASRDRMASPDLATARAG